MHIRSPLALVPILRANAAYFCLPVRGGRCSASSSSHFIGRNMFSLWRARQIPHEAYVNLSVLGPESEISITSGLSRIDGQPANFVVRCTGIQ